jgi:hypothetical protein
LGWPQESRYWLDASNPESYKSHETLGITRSISWDLIERLALKLKEIMPENCFKSCFLKPEAEAPIKKNSPNRSKHKMTQSFSF